MSDPEINYWFKVGREPNARTGAGIAMYIRVLIPYGHNVYNRYAEFEWKVSINEQASTPEDSPLESWQKYISDGNEFYVILDKASTNRGAIQAGATYVTKYSVVAGKGQYTTTGPAVTHGGQIITRVYTNADLNKNEISIFGRRYRFNDQGQVYDIMSDLPQEELVGHLSLKKE